MIVSEEHKADLIKLAKEYKYSAQYYPGIQEEEPKEKYLINKFQNFIKINLKKGV